MLLHQLFAAESSTCARLTDAPGGEAALIDPTHDLVDRDLNYAQAAERLAPAGVLHVRDLVGGRLAYERFGLPVGSQP